MTAAITLAKCKTDMAWVVTSQLNCELKVILSVTYVRCSFGWRPKCGRLVAAGPLFVVETYSCSARQVFLLSLFLNHLLSLSLNMCLLKFPLICLILGIYCNFVSTEGIDSSSSLFASLTCFVSFSTRIGSITKTYWSRSGNQNSCYMLNSKGLSSLAVDMEETRLQDGI